MSSNALLEKILREKTIAMLIVREISSRKNHVLGLNGELFSKKHRNTILRFSFCLGPNSIYHYHQLHEIITHSLALLHVTSRCHATEFDLDHGR